MEGHLQKIELVHEDPVRYRLKLIEGGIMDLNDCLGKTLHLSFLNEIHCIYCQAKTKKSYHQGYCFYHAQKLARCDLCVMSPDRCHFHLGTCREPDWGTSHCMQPTYVYLANNTGVKIGIMRESQRPVRWMDQGAVSALVILKTQTRQHAGLIEHLFRRTISDKSDWRALIRNESSDVDLHQVAQELLRTHHQTVQKMDQHLRLKTEYINEEVSRFTYPVHEPPGKIKSLSLDRIQQLSEPLLGMRGQYLFFPSGALNIRKHTGYRVKIESE